MINIGLTPQDFCNKNFIKDIPQDKISISESPFAGEYLQNALMISPPNCQIWLDVINEAKKRWEHKKNTNILYLTGPQLLSDIYQKNKNVINALPKKLYNPDKDSSDFNDDNVITKHFCSAVWVEK